MRTADEETEGIVVSDDVLQTDSVVPAGSGLFYATNLNERGDLRGHVRKQKLPLKKRRPFRSCWLANCYFTHDSSEFPVLLPFFHAPSGGSFHPFPCYSGPPARTWRCPFHRCGVASPQTPTPTPESFRATITESTRVGPHSCRLDGTINTPAGSLVSASMPARSMVPHFVGCSTAPFEGSFGCRST